MQVKKQLLKPDTEKLSGSKLRKEYDKAVHYHPVYLTSMQSTSCEMLGWMKHKLKSRLPGEISITSDMQMTPPFWQKAKEFQKNIYLCFIDYTKTFDWVIITNCGKLLKRWEYQAILPVS